MFKVICISKDTPEANDIDLFRAAEQIEVGGIYEVINLWEDYYELAEFPHHNGIFWHAKHFIPVSQIDETTFVREHLYQQNLK